MTLPRSGDPERVGGVDVDELYAKCSFAGVCLSPAGRTILELCAEIKRLRARDRYVQHRWDCVGITTDRSRCDCGLDELTTDTAPQAEGE